MNKCFITKLPSSVDNDNLPVLGHLKINWLKQDNVTDSSQRLITITSNDKITCKVSGAHFTDSTLTNNFGNTKTIVANNQESLYISNDADAILTIDNKYALTSLSFINDPYDYYNRSVHLNLEDIKYCTNLENLAINGIKIDGDISALSNLTNIRTIYANNTLLSGDISALRNLTNLTWLFLINTNVSGDISALSNLTKINHLHLEKTNVSGDISALSNLTNIVDLSLNNTNIGGKVDSLANLSNIGYLTNLNGLSLTGDMSKLNANAYFISQDNRKVSTNFTWTARGRQNAILLAMRPDIPFDTVSMDNMLIDQATCRLTSNTSKPYVKIISVKGTRTSASDAAVTAIQNMGITITGVTKEG